MPLPKIFEGLRLPAIAAPMFLASGPDLVVEVCRSGLVGTFPALNQRTTDGFVEWLTEIKSRLGEAPYAAPYGVNLIVHRSNPRLEADLYKIVEHKVPLIITSLGAVPDVVNAVHSYGGLVFHDVINRRHAEKAAQAGVDGIIAVTAGAGGHAGTLSPFALIPEIRSFFDGAIILSGAMSTGDQIAAARVMGADMAYLGTRFLATKEAMISDEQKRMTVDAKAADIFYTPAISGVAANFLRPSLVAAGLDPDNLVSHGTMDLGSEAKAWKAVWSAGQGVASLRDVPGAAELCERLIAEYAQAMAHAGSDPFATKGPSA
ncbi:NAD(P)H-dependent flavin oxidoreductase [Endobacterium cereale]|uniref:NAD(P)H-dependent flavin oxidoreductase n=1 Tax=Endobacterium cereale TaxID=2663029 RepID=UPI002B45A548|nr:nitronate monooxygenase family protein [Endobacterium cereale]MEB2843312.1 nitronate monooxygenase family protein [Endobacterium cereale]